MHCVYCDNPLDCLSCRTVYEPPDQAAYDALSRPEVPLTCRCGAVLVCYWCKTAYDGTGDEGQDGGED
jgi:hypothetical protein